MEYMNALSATTSVNEEAQNAYESMINYKDQAVEAKEQFKQQFAILPELVLGGSGEFLIKEIGTKAVSALADTAKAGAKSLIKNGLKKVGVSEEDAEAMSESVVSGDIQGVASKGANIVTNAVSDVAEGAGNVITGAVDGVRQIATDAVEQIQGGGDVLEAVTGAVGRVGDVVTTVAQQGSEIAGRALSTAGNVVDGATGAVEEARTLAQGLVQQGTDLASGALETAQGLAGSALETAQAVAGGALETAQGLAGGAIETAGGIASGVLETATDTMGEVGGGIFANLPDQDDILSILSRQTRPLITNDLLPEGAGTIIGQRTNVGEVGDETGFLDRAINLPSEIEMVNMADRTPPAETLPEGASSGVSTEIPITEPLATVPDVATAGAEVGAETGLSVGADVGVEVGAEVGLEAIGAGLDATGILAPLGALVGLFAGLGGLLGLEKHSAPPPPPPPPAVLNPSTNFGT